jgi:twinkle protein
LPCPVCSSSDAYSTWSDGHGFCFSCNTYVPPENKTNFKAENYTLEYLPWRNVSADSFRHYGVKTRIDSTGRPVSIVYPYEGWLKIRRLDVKEFYVEGTAVDGLFGRNVFAAGSHDCVTITEGELDAISLYQVVKHPVVSIRSSVTGLRDISNDRSWLRSFKRVYLAFDGDGAGQDALHRVAKLFDPQQLYHVKLTRRKDANEFLQHGEEDDLRRIWYNSKKYLPETIISSLSDFNALLSEEPKAGVDYPFPSITEKTYGIRRGETVLVTAQEGVGKTEFVRAIEHKILRDTDWNVGAFFLEEPPKRHLHGLAGLELNSPVHIPGSGFNGAEVSASLAKLLGSDERLFLHANFGSMDPDALLDTIRFLVVGRLCFCILLDHTTMVFSGRNEEDERRAIDYFSTKAEMMVKELQFAFINVCHVNDNGQTRGSRYPSKVADIRIDLFRNVSEGDNTIYPTVSKNRYCGMTGATAPIVFNPLTNRLSEEDNDRFSSIQTKRSNDNNELQRAG